MKLIQRVKNLWRLSKYEIDVNQPLHLVRGDFSSKFGEGKVTIIAKGMAQIIKKEDPLDDIINAKN